MTRAAGWLAALAALALVRSFLFATLTPPYQSSDEPWHLDYARVVSQGHLPVTGRTRIDPAIIRHDKHVSADRKLTLYGITEPLVAPFRGIFAQPAGTPIVEVAALLSIVFFVLVAALIVALVRAYTGRGGNPNP